MPLQGHYDIAELLSLKGIENVVMSPGSRCAPLTISMARHPKLKCYTISDERSAGFIGLGMAERSQKPVALLCTSGTASLNYYPAITEAFYRGIPLIVLTADRPPELIDQWDGQTIRQRDVYSNHILESLQLPVEIDNEINYKSAFRDLNNIINKAIIKGGPVHINVPIRDPLYPEKDSLITYSKNIPILNDIKPKVQAASSELKTQMNSFHKIMIVVGQMPENKQINKLLNQTARDMEAVIVADHISNIHPKSSFICHHDIFLSAKSAEKLPKPDLLITLGRSVLSKHLKSYLKAQKDLIHWQVGEYEPHDTYLKLAKVIKMPELRFLQAAQTFFESDEDYINDWIEMDLKCHTYLEKFNPPDFSEIKAISIVTKLLPKKADLHLSNSLSTRYLNLYQSRLSDESQVFCNRGTSGIDGCSSTSVGHAIMEERIQILITGDLAFFYDRNAFWHNYDISNLKIILLNNHGGGIFRVIKGPSEQKELDEFFDTRQTLNAENTARDFNMHYQKVSDEKQLMGHLKSFFKKTDRASILEIETNKELNTSHYKSLISDFHSAI